MFSSPKESKEECHNIIEGGNIPFLLGGTGIGKSAIVREIAEELANGKKLTSSVNPKKDEYGFISFRLGLVESIDLGGLPYVDDEGLQRKAYLGNLPMSGEGLFFLDEFAQADKSVQASMGQLLDPQNENEERRIGDYIFPKGWKIILAGNRFSDRSGANKILRHCKDRTTEIQFTHDADDWLEWAEKNDVNIYVQGLIRFMPQLLWVFDPKSEEPQPSPRSWVRLSDTLKTNPRSHLQQRLFEGDVGAVASMELLSFISLRDDVPNISSICKGDDVEVIRDEGLAYATTIALIDVISREPIDKAYDYFANALNYVEKFSSIEFSVFFVNRLTNICKDLKDSDTYSKFKIEHQELEIS